MNNLELRKQELMRKKELALKKRSELIQEIIKDLEKLKEQLYV